MRITSTTSLIRPFNLIRWFSLTALASIAFVSALSAWSFSTFLTERMIRQEAEVTAGLAVAMRGDSSRRSTTTFRTLLIWGVAAVAGERPVEVPVEGDFS